MCEWYVDGDHKSTLFFYFGTALGLYLEPYFDLLGAQDLAQVDVWVDTKLQPLHLLKNGLMKKSFIHQMQHRYTKQVNMIGNASRDPKFIRVMHTAHSQ